MLFPKVGCALIIVHCGAYKLTLALSRLFGWEIENVPKRNFPRLIRETRQDPCDRDHAISANIPRRLGSAHKQTPRHIRHKLPSDRDPSRKHWRSANVCREPPNCERTDVASRHAR